MPSLVLGHLLLNDRVVTLIPFIDDKVLFVGDLVAGSERCRCFCDAECLSITFDGFGPGGDPCIACGNIDGTYTLERRGTDNASGPWVYSYCGESACLVEGEPGCLEIILTLSCNQHTLSVLFCGSEILSATASNDGTKCDELTFTGAVGATCNPIGTITTGSAECGESSEQRCCDCPPCGTPQEWAIVDITAGFTILRSGGMAFSNTTIFDIPPAWPTRSWNTAPMPPVLRFGLFVRGTYETNCLQCESWFALETWTVVPRKCAGGDWYSEHTFAESYANTSCDSGDPLSVLVGPSVNQSNYDNIDFAGTVDCEWTNMKNWESTSGPTPLPWTIALPSEVTPIYVSGELLGDATGAAECKTLTITSTGTLGIHITVAETATIAGVVICGAAVDPCDKNACCNPQENGWVDAVGAVTVTGTNRGKITSDDDVTFDGGQNDGGLVIAGGDIEFLGASVNRGTLQAPAINFRGTSHNYDIPAGYECDWEMPQFTGAVQFWDDAQNHGSGFPCDLVVFNDSSINASGGSFQCACQFYDDSTNNGVVGSASEFYGGSQNASSGIVDGSAVFSSSDNYGLVRGDASFPLEGQNYGIVEGNGDFTNNGKNNAGGTVRGDAAFDGFGWNYGTIDGDATFSGSTTNYGTVQGNATFNGSSSNLGTVLGTITCNTTGTCSEQ